jgi:hypothetical protein
MSFLRKWGSSSGPAATATGSGGGAAAGEATKQEWYNESPGERYFGMENVSSPLFCYISPPSAATSPLGLLDVGRAHLVLTLLVCYGAAQKQFGNTW